MKQFKDGAEIRLSRDDLKDLLTDALNSKLFGICMDKHRVSELTLHPNNKYVIRITLRPEKII